MTDRWTERLSDYVDGEMAMEEMRALEAHLAGCASCARTIHDLRAIVEAAADLEDRGPEADLWPGIAARLGLDRAEGARVVSIEAARGRRSRRLALSLPQLAAAAVAFLLIGVAGTWIALDRPVGAPLGRAPEGAVPVTRVASAPVERSYAAAVAELEGVLDDSRGTLDPETVRAVEANLAIIDRAIEDTRRALAADPTDPYLNRHLASTYERKVQILRQATAATRTAI